MKTLFEINPEREAKIKAICERAFQKNQEELANLIVAKLTQKSNEYVGDAYV